MSEEEKSITKINGHTFQDVLAGLSEPVALPQILHSVVVNEIQFVANENGIAELNLMESTTILGFGWRVQSRASIVPIAQKPGDKTFEVVALLALGDDSCDDLWRHQYLVVQADRGGTAAYPIKPVGVVMQTGLPSLAVFELQLPFEKRVPSVKVLAAKAYYKDPSNAPNTLVDYETLPQEQQNHYVDLVQSQMSSLLDRAKARWS